MSAVTIDDRKVGREEWLEVRRSSIGASECATVLGLVPSKLRLYLDKKGLLEPEPPTEAMRLGLKLEDFIASEWSEKTGDPVVETQRFVRHPDMPWLSCTIDGVTASGRLVEFKRCGLHGAVRRIEGPDDLECLPDPWVIQCHAQMLVTGHDAVWFAVKLPDDSVTPIGPVRRNDNLCAIIARECEAFWRDHVESNVPPEEVTAADDRALARAFRGDTGEWLVLGEREGADAVLVHDLSARIRELEGRRDEARARLRLALGEAAGADLPGGWSVKRSVSTTRAHEVKESTRVTIKVRGPGES